MARSKKKSVDLEEKIVENALSDYKRRHPKAQIKAKRQNEVSIRLRVIDPDFKGMNRIDREPEVWKLLKKLPEDVFVQLTMVLLLTPDETKTSWANLEFNDPIPSRL